MSECVLNKKSVLTEASIIEGILMTVLTGYTTKVQFKSSTSVLYVDDGINSGFSANEVVSHHKLEDDLHIIFLLVPMF